MTQSHMLDLAEPNQGPVHRHGARNVGVDQRDRPPVAIPRGPSRHRHMGWTIGRHLFAALSALLATAVTFYFVSILNVEQSRGKSRALSTLTQFDVKKRPAKQPRTPSRIRKPRTPKRQVDRGDDGRNLIPNLPSRLGSQGLAVAADDGANPMMTSSIAHVTDAARRGSLRNEVYDAVDVQKPAAVRSRTAPAYPQAAVRAGISGYVRFKLMIDSQGDIRRIIVDRSDPQGVFEEAARQAVSQWAFEPAHHEGVTVSSWVFQTVRFSLQ